MKSLGKRRSLEKPLPFVSSPNAYSEAIFRVEYLAFRVALSSATASSQFPIAVNVLPQFASEKLSRNGIASRNFHEINGGACGLHKSINSDFSRLASFFEDEFVTLQDPILDQSGQT